MDFFPFNTPGDVAERIVTPLLLLFETRTDELLRSPHLLTRPLLLLLAFARVPQ